MDGGKTLEGKLETQIDLEEIMMGKRYEKIIRRSEKGHVSEGLD